MTVKIVTGDCLEALRAMPDESVHCVVTSPPYFGLRDYQTGTWEGGDPACKHVRSRVRTGDGLAALGERYRGGGHKAGAEKAIQFNGACEKCGAHRVDAQIGLEATLQEHIAKIVEVFREVWRVLRKDGVCWLNYGDAYASGGKASGGFKPKDRLMLPARIAIALCDDGWYLRDEIVWHKPNPMPSSVRDRTTPAHEMVYLLVKSRRYWYDAQAIAEPATYSPFDTKFPDNWDTGPGGHGNRHRNGREKGKRVGKNELTGDWRKNGFNERWDESERKRVVYDKPYNGHATKDYELVGVQNPSEVKARIVEKMRSGEMTTRNKRSVWTVATEPFADAHFATFPTALIEPMILAGCPARCCAQCGAPWVRETRRRFVPQPDVSLAKGVKGSGAQKPMDASNGWDGVPRGSMQTETLGFRAACACNAGVTAGTVLDPFGGSGTVGVVADGLGRNAVLIELNAEYVAMAARRIYGDLLAPLAVAE